MPYIYVYVYRIGNYRTINTRSKTTVNINVLGASDQLKYDSKKLVFPQTLTT